MIVKTIPTADQNTFAAFITALDKLLTIEPNRDYERYLFNQCIQKPQETVDEYITCLRVKGAHCQFNAFSLDEAIRLRIIEGCLSPTLKKPLMIPEVSELARIFERVDAQAASMAGTAAPKHDTTELIAAV